MSFRDLPHEVLNLVCSQIHDETSAPTATFSSLCLTSKHLLPLAREHLYYRPFSYETKITWAQAQALCKSLVENAGRLGRLVRSLKGIVPRLQQFRKPNNKVTLWYLAIIEACPRLNEIELCEGTTGTLDRIETALRESIATLRTVSFSNKSKGANDPTLKISTEHINETLSRPCLRNITTVELLDLGSRAHGWIVHQTWWTSDDTRRSLTPYAFPRFRFLQILGDATFFDNLPQVVLPLAVPSLRHYTFIPHVPESECKPALNRYARLYHFGNDLAMFRALANLTSITINKSRGCFLDLLATLSSSSPLLEYVDFHGSHWIQRNDASFRGGGIKTFEERYVPACSKSEVESLLDSFTSLRYIDLGVLPTTNAEDYEGLGNDLKGKGVTIDWDYCRVEEPCWKCGAVHE